MPVDPPADDHASESAADGHRDRAHKSHPPYPMKYLRDFAEVTTRG